jgi:hypothetical protein
VARMAALVEIACRGARFDATSPCPRFPVHSHHAFHAPGRQAHHNIRQSYPIPFLRSAPKHRPPRFGRSLPPLSSQVKNESSVRIPPIHRSMPPPQTGAAPHRQRHRCRTRVGSWRRIPINASGGGRILTSGTAVKKGRQQELC